MKMQVGLEGFDQFQKLLDKMPQEVAKKTVEGAVMAGARVIRDEAKALAPRKDGRLIDSIIARIDKKVFTKFGSITALVGPNLRRRHGRTAPHAHLVEFGTKPHTITTEKLLADGTTVFGRVVQHPGAAPHPFMRPAWDGRKAEAKKKIAQSMFRGMVRNARFLASQFGLKRRRR